MILQRAESAPIKILQNHTYSIVSGLTHVTSFYEFVLASVLVYVQIMAE